MKVKVEYGSIIVYIDTVFGWDKARRDWSIIRQLIEKIIEIGEKSD